MGGLGPPGCRCQRVQWCGWPRLSGVLSVGEFNRMAEEDSGHLFFMNCLWRMRRKGLQSSHPLPDYRNMLEKCENTG